MYSGILELDNDYLNIEWTPKFGSNGKGHTHINIKRFFDMHSMSKFRKLLKIIRESDTPEEEQKMKDWIPLFFEKSKEFEQAATDRKYEYMEKVRFHEAKVKYLQYVRDKNLSNVMRNSPEYKEMSKSIKEEKQRLSQSKAGRKQAEQDIKGIQSDREFIKKCLELIN